MPKSRINNYTKRGDLALKGEFCIHFCCNKNWPIFQRFHEIIIKSNQNIMMNIEMYTQMGYTEQQVMKAQRYSEQNRVDMFDALQVLQSQTRKMSADGSQKNIPPYSFLTPITSLNVTEYEVLFSRNGIKSQQAMAKEEIRAANTPVGLLNVSNCCYLNSLLQCYFLMGSLTRQVLKAQPIPELPEHPDSRVKNKRIQNQYKLLAALKQIFARLKLSSKKYLDPSSVLSNLVNSLGEKIEYGDEKDLHEINTCIVERLSECLMYTRKYYSSSDDSPSKNRKNENIKKLFYGSKIQYTEGSDSATVDFLGLILNPKHGNLLTAIDCEFNYEVQIDGEKRNRTTYIKDLPEYFFININRTGYKKQANQLLKNSQKMSFDFIIYLDRYLDKNKEQSKLVNPKIIQLLKRKNFITNQINHLELLATKLEECRDHAKYLKGWEERLPKKEELMKEKKQFQREISKIEGQLVEIESRKEKFVLMYLFVHRGDAISGHYWGYGRNGRSWYRFDINCSKIEESEILIDIERSGGIPYAMVYVRDNQIESFNYPYHLKVENQALLDLAHQNSKTDYIECIDPETRQKIIEENTLLHKIIEKQKNKGIIAGVLQDYNIKYNLVLTQGEQFSKNQSKLPNYENYALFLHSINEKQFMKYNIFSICFYDQTKMTTKDLLEKDKLLKSLQKSFRRKIKGKMALRHYVVECEPEEGQKYKNYQEEYLVGKKCVEFIKAISANFASWPNMKIFQPLLDGIAPIIGEEKHVLYIKSLTRQFMAILVLDLAQRKQPVKQFWVQTCEKKNSLLGKQIKALSAQITNKDPCEENPLQNVEIERTWKIESLKKVEQNQILSQMKVVIKKMQKAMQIYTVNVKQSKIIESKESADLI